jgi:hypothetical protein
MMARPLDDCSSKAGGDDLRDLDLHVLEFEAEARTAIIETWRVLLTGPDHLDDEEVADPICSKPSWRREMHGLSPVSPMTSRPA